MRRVGGVWSFAGEKESRSHVWQVVSRRQSLWSVEKVGIGAAVVRERKSRRESGDVGFIVEARYGYCTSCS